MHLEDTLDPDGTPRWTPNRGNNTIEYVDMSYTVALESSRGAAKVNLEVHLHIKYTYIHANIHIQAPYPMLIHINIHSS